MLTLTPRQRMTFLAHLWKASTQQHHQEMIPLLARYVPKNGVVLDIGAHAGQYAKLFARLAAHGRVIAVEPQSYARAILTRAIGFNGLKHVEIVAEGLSDQPGQATISVPLKKSGSFGFGLATLGELDGSRPTFTETVQLTTVDRLVAAKALTRLDFIKLDVEGFEGRVLAGAAAAIAKHKPALLVELVPAHLARAGDTGEAVLAPFAALGYAIFKLSPTPTLVAGFDGEADYVLAPPGGPSPA